MKKLLFNEFLKISSTKSLYIFCLLLIIITSLLTIRVDNLSNESNEIVLDQIVLKIQNDHVQYNKLKVLKKEQDLKSSYVTKHKENFKENIKAKTNITFTILMFASVYIVVISSNVIAKEYENKTIKLLYLSKEKRYKILFSKFLIVLLVTLFISFLIYLTNLITISIYYHTNVFDLKYLYLNSKIITQGNFVYNYTLKYLTILVSYLFIITSSLFLATIFKKSSLSIAFNIVLILSSTIITDIFLKLNIKQIIFTPVPYIDLTIFLDKVNILYYNIENSINLNLTSAIFIILIASAILYITSYIIFNKRELR